MSNNLSSLRLGFAGTPEFAVPALDALIKTGRICGVFTQPDRPAGRGRTLHASPVKALATARGLRVHQPASFKSPEALEMLRGLQLDALIVVAYGLILPTAALRCPKLGCINIHASLLPRWRGAAPIQRAILTGDAKTGVSIMRMDAGLDTGPLLTARELELDPGDTAGTVRPRLALLGAELIVETLDALAGGRVREAPQPALGVTYAEKVTKAEALIDWRQDAVSISRLVRAFNPWPIAETRFEGAQLRIWEAEAHESAMTEVTEASRPGVTGQPYDSRPNVAAGTTPGTVLAATQDGIDIACGLGILRILRLQLAGRKPLAAREFLQGQRLAGARFAPP